MCSLCAYGRTVVLCTYTPLSLQCICSIGHRFVHAYTFPLKFNTRPSHKSFAMHFVQLYIGEMGSTLYQTKSHTSKCNVSMCRMSDIVLFRAQTLSSESLARTSYNDYRRDNMTNSVDVYLLNYCQC